MKWTLAVALVFCICIDSSLAEGITHDSHSVESIRAALKTPIPSQILQQAKQFDDQVVQSRMVQGQHVALVTDSRNSRSTQIVSKLLQAIRGGSETWVVRMLDTNPKIENAFVVGGRYIYVYTGLLDNVQSDDELAFVLGHEISHSLLKHQTRRTEDSTNVLASIIQLGATLSKNAGTKESLGVVGGTIKAAYTREDEREADALGAYIAKKAGYDPSKAIAFFNRMIQLENSINAQNQSQLASANQTVQQQLTNCENLKAQWSSQPQIRTQQNAQIINDACNTAAANAGSIGQYSKDQLKSTLMRDHPMDSDRIRALSAETGFLNGTRTLDSLSAIGQGYNVLVAVNAGGSNISADLPCPNQNVEGRIAYRDNTEMIRCTRSDAEAGNARAQHGLGVWLLSGLYGLPKDEVQAVTWLRKAAEQGYVYSQLKLGQMYESGQGLSKDEVQAVIWYKKAADQGNTSAIANLQRLGK